MTKEKTRAITQDKSNTKAKRCCIAYSVINKFLLGVMLVVGIYYMTTVNDLTVKGFELQKLKAEINEISEDNFRLKQEVTYLQSYANIEQRINGLDMVAVGDFSYIEGNFDFVAKR